MTAESEIIENGMATEAETDTVEALPTAEAPDAEAPALEDASGDAAIVDAAAEAAEEPAEEPADGAHGDSAGDDEADDGTPLDPEALRLVEAILFAAVEPLDEGSIAARLPEGSRVPALLKALQADYATRGVNLVRVAKKWALRTAPDLGEKLQIEREASRKLSRAAIETLSIIAYHQPITRAEVENIRGVAVNRGTLDVLLEADWIKPGRRREVPGRPVTWLTTEAFLDHFGLESLKDLPGIKELKAAGLIDARPAISVYSERAQESEEEAGGAADEIVAEPLADEDTPAES